jgi:hypothetical protein
MSEISLRERLWHPRGKLCGICRRPTRGFGWINRYASKQKRQSVWFCSMSCQGVWSRLAKERLGMVDLSEQEQAAIRAVMKMVAESMEEIGWETRLFDLSEAQVLTLIEVAVGGFQDAMFAMAKNDDTEIPF